MNINWLHVTLIIAFTGILILLFFIILQKCFHPKTRTNTVVLDSERGQNLQNAISRINQISPYHNLDTDKSKKSNNYHVFFSWADHPSLIADAVENGWSRFAFTNFTSSPSVKSARSILGTCGASDHRDDVIGDNIEINWEVCDGSLDYMQKIRLNPGLKKMITAVNSSMMAVSVIRTNLPLPGPRFGNSCFPQEAYFEVTILPGNEDISDEFDYEGEKIKLIGEDNRNDKDYLSHVRSSHSQRRSKVEEKTQQDGKNEIIWLSVGLSGKGHLPLKIPGSFSGSIGFNSNGSVYLNGIKLVFESENNEWPQRSGKVIGCGYNPSQKKVFFTVDSQLVHEIHCKTEEFSHPLYPTLAANTDVMILVNLGQRPFKFGPGNLQRNPNPCFVRAQQPNSPALLGYEDSNELFSMGRIDSQWLQRSVTIRSNNNRANSVRSLDIDQESEGDLFEIVLDNTGRSPYATK